MNRSFFEGDVIGTKAPPTADLGPLFASSIDVHEATEKGIQDAHDHANDAWKQQAYAALVAVARRTPLFTADEVWAALKGSTTSTHEPSALGPLFRIAAHKGLIQKSGRMVKTKLIQRHREVTEWRSLSLDSDVDKSAAA